MGRIEDVRLTEGIDDVIGNHVPKTVVIVNSSLDVTMDHLLGNESL
jgi:hypothetical protein